MSTSARPRTLLVDDMEVVRQGFGLCHPALDVVATCAAVEDLAALAAEGRLVGLDLIVLDLHLRRVDGRQRQGLAAIEQVARLGAPICLYTSEERRLVLARCLQAGAAGIVHKQDPLPVATQGFLAVAAGRTHVTPALVGLAETMDRRGHLPELSTRQRQVLAARARGERWNSIAARLFITPSVAQEHLDHAVKKFADQLRGASAADLERALGLAPGDLFDEDARGSSAGAAHR